MEHLLHSWRRIAQPLDTAYALILLDFDGTLAPIVRNPAEASIPDRTRRVLERLARKDWCAIGIISGRSLKDLRDRVGMEGVIYGGNHGAELSGPGIDFEAPRGRDIEQIMGSVARSLDLLRSLGKRVVVENKGQSVALHFRGVRGADLPALLEAASDILKPFLSTGLVRVAKGKKVLDITSRAWDKGKAVLWLLEHLRARRRGPRPVFPVYVGDDMTDEDAFAVTRKEGLAVIVGKTEYGSAQYYLRNLDEVRRFLLYVLVGRGHYPSGPQS